jgi:hypothetical protein
MTTQDEPGTASFDAVVGLGALASPLWLQIIDASARHLILVGGAVLVLLRLYRAALRLVPARPPRRGRPRRPATIHQKRRSRRPARRRPT